MPKRISPRMTGSTAIARSFRRNHSMARELGASLVASLRTFASARYFTAYRSIRIRWERNTLSRGTPAGLTPLKSIPAEASGSALNSTGGGVTLLSRTKGCGELDQRRSFHSDRCRRDSNGMVAEPEPVGVAHAPAPGRTCGVGTGDFGRALRPRLAICRARSSRRRGNGLRHLRSAKATDHD